MVIAECHRIILKSESAGNSEDGSHNSAIIFFEYIPFPKALAILVFQPRVLTDGGRIDLVFVNTFRRRIGEYKYMAVYPKQISLYPFPRIEAFPSEKYLSHDLQFLLVIGFRFLNPLEYLLRRDKSTFLFCVNRHCSDDCEAGKEIFSRISYPTSVSTAIFPNLLCILSGSFFWCFHHS